MNTDKGALPALDPVFIGVYLCSSVVQLLSQPASRLSWILGGANVRGDRDGLHARRQHLIHIVTANPRDRH
jgi:hypothetical protein